jgi:hypothetical protein
MIDDLDRSLEVLLTHELPPALVQQVTITFLAPDSQFPPTSVPLPAIDLFLYDVRDNHELRSAEWTTIRQPDGRILKAPPSARVDCAYLITAWTSSSSTTPAFDEHHVLGEVMQVLLRHRTLPTPVLQGVLADQEVPPPTTSLQPGSLRSLSEFWQLLGGKPKATLNFTVTISVPVGAPRPVGPPATDARLTLAASSDNSR